MQSRFLRQSALLVSLVLLLSLFVVDATGQSRKKRRPRRVQPRPVVTNPIIAPAGRRAASRHSLRTNHQYR